MNTSNENPTAVEPQQVLAPVVAIASMTPAPGRPGRFITVSTADGAEVHCDTIDPNSAIARKRFVGATMRAAFKETEPDDWPDDVRAQLDKKLLELRAVPPGPTEPPPAAAKEEDDPRIEALAKMPAEVRAEAERRLRDPGLIDCIREDIERLGVVGEKNNRLLIYLVGTSAQLSRPLAAIARGSSSSGKSFLCERVSRLFPPEVVKHATGITTNALYYFEPGELRHRFIVAGERSRVEDDDQAEATRALREMIESGRLSKAVPVKEGDRMVTKLIEQQGPIAYLETTTLDKIFGEDANRCLLLNTDEGAEQTRLIIDATAAAAAGAGTAAAARICEIHHAIQRMLPRVDVDIPFAWAIAKCYPTTRLESRRDFRHLLQLVRASALLHFKQRTRDQDGRLIATITDYEVAEDLAKAPLGVAASGISEDARRFLIQVREMLLKGADNPQTDDGKKAALAIEFATSAIRDLPGRARRTNEARLSELQSCGCVEQTVAGKGRVPAKWKLTGKEPEPSEGVVPTVKQVVETLSGCARAHNE